MGEVEATKYQKANAIYNVLESVAGAHYSGRTDFVRAYCAEDCISEWRFQGLLGFGGKYRGHTNTVDCYSEDLTPERQDAIDKTNFLLNTKGL